MCCNRKFKPRLRSRPAFTLIELTAVLALMAILAGIVTVNVRHYLVKGKQDAARVEIATICDAIEAFYTAEGRYPTNQEGLAVLSRPAEAGAEPLLKHAPVDSWGHAYQYNCPGRNNEPYEVICFGADGREGGVGADADIYSWSVKPPLNHGGGDASPGAAHAAGQ